MSMVSVKRVVEERELGMVAKTQKSYRPHGALLTNNIKLVRTGDKSQSGKAGTMIRVTRQVLDGVQECQERVLFPVSGLSTDHVSHNTSLSFCHKHFKNSSRLISPVNDLQYFVNPSYYIGTYYIETLFSPSMNPK